MKERETKTFLYVLHYTFELLSYLYYIFLLVIHKICQKVVLSLNPANKITYIFVKTFSSVVRDVEILTMQI